MYSHCIRIVVPLSSLVGRDDEDVVMDVAWAFLIQLALSSYTLSHAGVSLAIEMCNITTKLIKDDFMHALLAHLHSCMCTVIQ